MIQEIVSVKTVLNNIVVNDSSSVYIPKTTIDDSNDHPPKEFPSV